MHILKYFLHSTLKDSSRVASFQEFIQKQLFSDFNILYSIVNKAQDVVPSILCIVLYTYIYISFKPRFLKIAKEISKVYVRSKNCFPYAPN